jgi:hypothetical protein
LVLVVLVLLLKMWQQAMAIIQSFQQLHQLLAEEEERPRLAEKMAAQVEDVDTDQVQLVVMELLTKVTQQAIQMWTITLLTLVHQAVVQVQSAEAQLLHLLELTLVA